MKNIMNSITFFAVVVIMVMMTGCAGTSTDSADTADVVETVNEPVSVETLKFGIVFDNIEDQCNIAFNAKAQEYCDENGYELVALSSDYDPQTQAEKIESLISQGVNGIAYLPLDESSTYMVLQEAEEADIPVITFSATVDEESQAYLAAQMKLPDYEEGSIVAQYVVDQLAGEEGNVVIIHGTEGMSSTTVRGAGMTDTLATASAPITVLDTKYTDWKKDQAMAAMENFIAQYGDTIDYVLCSYEPLAEGAAEAIEAAGLGDEIKVLSIGISSTSKQYQLDGKIVASCTVPYQGMALQAMTDFAALAGGDAIEPEYLADYSLLVGDEIADYTPEY